MTDTEARDVAHAEAASRARPLNTGSGAGLAGGAAAVEAAPMGVRLMGCEIMGRAFPSALPSLGALAPNVICYRHILYYLNISPGGEYVTSRGLRRRIASQL